MTEISRAVRRPSSPPLPPFQWVLEEHAASVLRFLLRIAGPVDAEDCFQETMLAALRAYPSLQHGANLRGWLMAIARNKALDSRRSASRRPMTLGDIEPAAAPEPDGEGPAVWQSVGRLPAKQRRAVKMRFAEDRSYADIAGAMSTSQDAARRNVHEGIKKLRREMR